MSNSELSRIDERLIHRQVGGAVGWVCRGEPGTGG